MLVAAGVLTGVSAVLLSTGISLYNSSSESANGFYDEYEDSYSTGANDQAAAELLLTLSLYSALGAIPLWIVGAIKKKKNETIASRVEPFVREERRKPIVFRGAGMGLSSNGFALAASVQF